MAPKNKDKNQSKPEKCAELKEGWAEHLALKYDDKTYGDRFGIQFFVENFNSNVLENSSDADDDVLQIFDVFCLMAFNSLKTENDINDLRAKAASGKNKNAKSNATMDYSSLRFAVVSHFMKVTANHHKIAEFNTVFYSHFTGGKIPNCFWDHVQEAMEECPEDLDAWILKYHSSKSDYQRVDKLKVYFGDCVITRATKCTANIVNNLNPLWNPVPPSGKSISDMLRAIKLQRFRAGAHKNAIQSMRKKEGYISGAWGDPEKLAYVRGVVEEKLEKYDPARKHPKNWLAFLLCSHPIDHFTGRRLSLQSCVPPHIGQPDNV